jgi:mono/diheme cytochrome c family protein/LmbE family N-acetylglucosaminyl deacetylase
MFLAVSALRTRGKEEVAPNLASATTDEEIETRRLERFQQAAVLMSAFLAVGMALYFLGENQRQADFVTEFSDASIKRGEHIVAEFKCFNCHGPGGAGGSAPYLEKRSGIAVPGWAAPSLNDIFFRYDRDEITYWVTYGRGNTPMPPWGLAGGGPLSPKQVLDVVSYLSSIQIEQGEVLGEIEGAVAGELQRLAGADANIAAALVKQQQLLADINRAPGLTADARAIAERARDVLDAAASGLDTDGDGVSDSAEAEISALTAQLSSRLTPEGLVAFSFAADNPMTSGRPDFEVAEEAAANLEGLATTYPVLGDLAAAAQDALAVSGTDTDDDGLADEAEDSLTQALRAAVDATRPLGLTVVVLDPKNVESVSGQRDSRTAAQAVAAIEGIALQLKISNDNQKKLVDGTQLGVDYLLEAQADALWAIDIEGVANVAFGGNVEDATRAVGLFNGFCARCHTSGWSAGLSFTQEAGSGGFGPALWEGRPIVQFKAAQDLIDFITKGSQGQTPYGVNGFGSGRMPAFGMILSADDIELIATYLRGGNLTGKE